MKFYSFNMKGIVVFLLPGSYTITLHLGPLCLRGVWVILRNHRCGRLPSLAMVTSNSVTGEERYNLVWSHPFVSFRCLRAMLTAESH